MKGILLLGLLLGIRAAAGPGDDPRTLALRFDEHWNVYLRKAFGCPLVGDTTAANCLPAKAQVDYAEFAKAREEAKRLFDLKD